MATILVVEDQQELLNVVAQMLRTDGHTVVTAANGRIAEDYLASGRELDLVLTDIFMPEQDGIGVLLSARRRARPLPIVAMSGGGQVLGGDFLAATERLGVARTLRKPFTRTELREAVAAALDG